MSYLTEILPWVHQLKSLVQANSLLQSETISLASLIFLGYLILIALKFTVSRAILLLAVSLCIMISYSPLYSLLTEYEYHLIFALIYAIATTRLYRRKGFARVNAAQIKMAAGCCIMAIFNIFMAMDAYTNEGIQTWAYKNYEVITLGVHVLIMSAAFRFNLDRLKRGILNFVNTVRSFVHVASYNWGL